MNKENTNSQVKDRLIKIFYYTKGVILVSFFASTLLAGFTITLLAIFTKADVDALSVTIFATLLIGLTFMFAGCVLLYNVNITLWTKVSNCKQSNEDFEFILKLLPDIKYINDMIWDFGKSKILTL